VTFPCSLQSLRFGRDFKQNLEGLTFPSSLHTFAISDLLVSCQ
jgi:hypothetical protein